MIADVLARCAATMIGGLIGLAIAVSAFALYIIIPEIVFEFQLYAARWNLERLKRKRDRLGRKLERLERRKGRTTARKG